MVRVQWSLGTVVIRSGEGTVVIRSGEGTVIIGYSGHQE